MGIYQFFQKALIPELNFELIELDPEPARSDFINKLLSHSEEVVYLELFFYDFSMGHADENNIDWLEVPNHFRENGYGGFLKFQVRDADGFKWNAELQISPEWKYAPTSATLHTFFRDDNFIQLQKRQSEEMMKQLGPSWVNGLELKGYFKPTFRYGGSSMGGMGAHNSLILTEIDKP